MGRAFPHLGEALPHLGRWLPHLGQAPPQKGERFPREKNTRLDTPGRNRREPIESTSYVAGHLRAFRLADGFDMPIGLQEIHVSWSASHECAHANMRVVIEEASSSE